MWFRGRKRALGEDLTALAQRLMLQAGYWAGYWKQSPIVVRLEYKTNQAEIPKRRAAEYEKLKADYRSGAIT